jgi:hypothetical protein
LLKNPEGEAKVAGWKGGRKLDVQKKAIRNRR